jgi:hypothetical protein
VDDKFKILIGASERSKSLGLPRRAGRRNIKMGFQETGYGSMDWIHLA